MQQFPCGEKWDELAQIIRSSSNLVISRNAQGVCIMASLTVHLGLLTWSGYIQRLNRFPGA